MGRKSLRGTGLERDLLSVFLVLLVVGFLSVPGRSSAQAVSIDDETQRRFVVHLVREKLYFEAIAEAHRFLFLFPASPMSEEVQIALAEATILGGDERGGLDLYRAFLDNYPRSPRAAFVRFAAARLQANAGLYDDSTRDFVLLSRDEVVPPALRLDASRWLVLATMLNGRPREETMGVTQELKLADDQILRGEIDGFYDLNLKSPSLAGALSAVVPGAGQLYVGRQRDALVAFLLNGLFIWGAVEAFNDGSVGVGALLATFEIGWYGGNIYTAINGAHKLNRATQENYRNSYLHTFNLLSR